MFKKLHVFSLRGCAVGPLNSASCFLSQSTSPLPFLLLTPVTTLEPLAASCFMSKQEECHALTCVCPLNNPGSPLWSKEKMKPIVVQEGVSLILPCRPPAGLPPPIIFWMDNCEHITLYDTLLLTPCFSVN